MVRLGNASLFRSGSGEGLSELGLLGFEFVLELARRHLVNLPVREMLKQLRRRPNIFWGRVTAIFHVFPTSSISLVLGIEHFSGQFRSADEPP